MQMVSKEQFEAFLANNATLSETETEHDDKYAYENFLNLDGEEIAFICYMGGEVISYHIAA